MLQMLKNEVLVDRILKKELDQYLWKKAHSDFLKCLVCPGGGNLRAQFLSHCEGFGGCQVCFNYLSYTSNFVESFKRFWYGDAFLALWVAETVWNDPHIIKWNGWIKKIPSIKGFWSLRFLNLDDRRFWQAALLEDAKSSLWGMAGIISVSHSYRQNI